jgi:hypothetical protein
MALYLMPGAASSSRPTSSTLSTAGNLRGTRARTRRRDRSGRSSVTVKKKRRDRAVDRGRLHPVLALVHLKPANILSLRRIGRLPQEGCEAAHKANIIVLRM